MGTPRALRSSPCPAHSNHKLRWRPTNRRRAGAPSETTLDCSIPCSQRHESRWMLLWQQLDRNPVSQLPGSSTEERTNGETTHAVHRQASVLQLPLALASKGSSISEIGSTSRSRVFVEIRPTNNEIRGLLHMPSHSNRSDGTNEHAPL